MTSYRVSAGATSDGITLSAGDQMVVLAGGNAVDTTVDPGALLLVSSGGVAGDTTVSGLQMQVNPGGTAINTTVAAGGNVEVFSDPLLPGVAIGNTVLSGGVLAGNTSDTTVEAGGTVFGEVYSGFVAGTAVIDFSISMTVSGSASQPINRNAAGVPLGNAFAVINVIRRRHDRRKRRHRGGLRHLARDGHRRRRHRAAVGATQEEFVYDTTVSSGGLLLVSWKASNTVLDGGVLSGEGFSFNVSTTISAGGARILGWATSPAGPSSTAAAWNISDSGGEDIAATVSSGGTQYVEFGRHRRLGHHRGRHRYGVVRGHDQRRFHLQRRDREPLRQRRQRHRLRRRSARC